MKTRDGVIRDYSELSMLNSFGFKTCWKCGLPLKVGDHYHIQRRHKDKKWHVAYWHKTCWDVMFI